MTPIKPTLAKRAPRGMEMARLGSREMREFIEAEAIDIFTTMTNGGCTFQQSLTDDEIVEIAATPAAIPGAYVHCFARAIEAKLKEKNA